MKRAILLAAAALAATACSNTTIDDSRVPLEFTARPATSPPPSMEPSVTVTAGAGHVVVEGALSTPDPCQNIEAAAVALGEGRLQLTVSARQRDGACADVIGRFSYTARLLRLPPGSYVVEVIHEPARGAWEPSRHEAEVTVF